MAACLGLDPDQYKSRAPVDQQEEGERDEDKFRYVDHLVVSCVCGEKCKLSSPTQGKGRAEKPSLAKCPAAKDCGGYPLQREGVVAGAIDLLVRKSLAKYYAGWLVCEDPGCSGRTRCLPLQFQRAFPVCPVCRKATMFTEVSPTSLYTQLQVDNAFGEVCLKSILIISVPATHAGLAQDA